MHKKTCIPRLRYAPSHASYLLLDKFNMPVILLTVGAPLVGAPPKM